jgi:hypothetical protein
MIHPQYSANVGYDVDETLWHGVNDRFQDYLVKMGHAFDAQVFTASGGSWNAATGFVSPRISEIFEQYFLSDMCPDPIPIPGAREVLSALREVVVAQHIVTARAEGTRSRTITQLEQYYPGCIQHHWFQFTRCKNKAICTNGIDIFVEDNCNEAEVILRESDHPVWVILFANFTSPGSVPLHHKRLIRLPVSNEIEPGIPRQLWKPLWRRAWMETQVIISNLLEQHYRTTALCGVS